MTVQPMKVREGPTDFEAVQLTDDADWNAIAEWCDAPLHVHEPGDLKDQLAVPTPKGTRANHAWANVGDWIVKDAAGEFRVCPPERFAATYETAPLIGPLTADEWCSLRLGTDDDPFQCCGDTSALRSAAFAVLQLGGGQEWGMEFHAAWLRVTKSHPEHTLAEHPVVGKLYRFYVEGKEPPPSDGELDTWLAERADA